MSEDPKLFDAGDYNLFRYCHNDPVDFTDPMGLDTMANAMAVAEAVVPGQYEYNQMVANFQSGNYGNAAGWGITWVSSGFVGVVSGTTSTRAKPIFGRLVLRLQREKRSLELGTDTSEQRKLGRLVEKERFHWWT